ncbi:Oxygen sensor histidine kinase nreB [Bacteroidales bacterium Barb6]|nr:Oxygen sensor histidine kinase nreB [Bacteroidales bacterium Barb6]
MEYFRRNIREKIQSLSEAAKPAELSGTTLNRQIADYLSSLTLPETIHLRYTVEPEGVQWIDEPSTPPLIFGILKEALNNSVKYAGATCITVSLMLDGDRLTLEIADNGRGMEQTKKQGGIDLRLFAKEVKKINGTLDIRTGSTGSTGTCITVTLPA